MTAPLRKTPILVIVLLSYLMIVVDISIVITALPKIHHSLGLSAPALSWVQNAYLLAGDAHSSPVWGFSHSHRSPSALRHPRRGS
jgi:MFS family permease